MEWWAVCLVQLCKGISWTMPIAAVFIGLAWFIGHVIKDMPEKKQWFKSSEE